jgi:hypothetical protein
MFIWSLVVTQFSSVSSLGSGANDSLRRDWFLVRFSISFVAAWGKLWWVLADGPWAICASGFVCVVRVLWGCGVFDERPLRRGLGSGGEVDRGCAIVGRAGGKMKEDR